MHFKSMKLISSAIASFLTVSTGFTSVFVTEAQAATGASPTSQTSSIQSDRLSGNDRYDTSIAISKATWANGADYVVVVRGDEFPDGLCAGPLAYKYNAPILLTNKDTLDSRINAEIQRLKPKQIFMLGGTGALSTSVENALKSIAPTERISGSNRYETSVKIAEKLGTINKAVIATGASFVDSLSISPIAAKDDMPILLSPKDQLDSSVTSYLKSQNISKTYIVGGEGVLNSNIDKSVTNPQRLAGANRYLTNLAVIKSFESELNFNKVYFASAYNDVNGFADALSGSVTAAKNSAPIVLVADKAIDKDLSDYIISKFNSTTHLTSLGGESVVSQSLIDGLITSSGQITHNNPAPTNAPIINSVIFSATTSSVVEIDNTNYTITVKKSNIPSKGTVTVTLSSKIQSVILKDKANSKSIGGTSINGTDSKTIDLSDFSSDYGITISDGLNAYNGGTLKLVDTASNSTTYTIIVK